MFGRAAIRLGTGPHSSFRCFTTHIKYTLLTTNYCCCYYYYHYTAIIQDNQHQPAPTLKVWKILLEQSFTVHMFFQKETSAFGLGRRCQSSPQQCYLHRLDIMTHKTYIHRANTGNGLESLPKWSNKPSISSPVVNDEMIRPGHWPESATVLNSWVTGMKYSP